MAGASPGAPDGAAGGLAGSPGRAAGGAGLQGSEARPAPRPCSQVTPKAPERPRDGDRAGRSRQRALCCRDPRTPEHTHVGAVTSFHRDGAGSAAAFRRRLPAPLAPSPALGRHPRSARHCPLRTSARFLQPPGGPGPRPHAEDCLRLTRCDDQNRNSAPPDVNLPLSFVATPPHAPPSSWLLSKMAEQEAGSNARQVTRADRPRKGPGPGPGGCGRRALGSALGPAPRTRPFWKVGLSGIPAAPRGGLCLQQVEGAQAPEQPLAGRWSAELTPHHLRGGPSPHAARAV